MCQSGTVGTWTIGYVPLQPAPPAPPIVINGVTTTVTVTNTFDCVSGGGGNGSLIVTKQIINDTNPQIPTTGMVFPISASCVSGMSPAVVTPMPLQGNGSQTLNPLALNTVCTITEGTIPPLPPGPVLCLNQGDVPTWTTGLPAPVTITGQGMTAIVQNTLDCKPAQGGSLIVKKVVVAPGAGALPAATYPVNVTCGGNTTTLNLSSDGTPQTVSNIPYGTNCSVVEPTPPVPPNACPPNTTGTWSIVSAPSSIPPINVDTTTVTVTNTLTCTPSGNGSGQVGALVVTKNVTNNTQGSVTNTTYAVNVTCGGAVTPLTLTPNVPQTVSNIPYQTQCSVAETEVLQTPPLTACINAPTHSAPVWTTTITPTPVTISAPSTAVTVQNTLDCKPTSDPNYGHVSVKKAIQNNNTQVNVSTLTFSVAVTCGNTTSNLTIGLNIGMTTWFNVPPGAVCTAVETPPAAPTTGCPAGQTPVWTTPPSYAPPSVTTAVGANPIITVTNTLNCVPSGGAIPPQPPQCPKGKVFVAGKGCVTQTTCLAPMIPGPVSGTCVCPAGQVQKGKSCVEPVVCHAPQKLNKAGTGCICPEGMTMIGGACVAQGGHQNPFPNPLGSGIGGGRSPGFTPGGTPGGMQGGKH
jgi:hypothetical protein